MLTKWMKKAKEDQRGLTLVELLAVVVILAIVGAIAFVLIGNVMENSRKDAHIANAQQIISAAKMYDSTEIEIDDTTGVKLEELQKKQLIGTLSSPWKDTTYPEATDIIVKKSTGNVVEYSISGFSVAGKCEGKFKTGASETDLNGDRDTICGN